ncbi:MAG: hypothetical protein V3U90_07840 [Dehalococcoidia bacterium]
MNAEEIRRATARSPALFKIAPMFTMLGLGVIMAAFIIGIVLAVTAGDYYAYDKVTRDTAGAGSAILDDLSFLHSMPAWTLPFTFVGVSSLLVGIALIFSTIIGRIRLRASSMELALPKIIEARRKSN